MALYPQITIIGLGLIGSSLARAIQQHELTDCLVASDNVPETLTTVQDLKLADRTESDLADAVKDADLVILATPVGTYADLAKAMVPHLKDGATVSDVGSVKTSVLKAFTKNLPDHVHAIPGHPVAGTEQSGPEAGFTSLFQDRWCILTPPKNADQEAINSLTKLWEAVGSNVEIMDAEHHDRVLAITSHLPHLIAYNIVGTAHDLEEVTKSEVIKFSAGGFRDFTRIAASNPTMWRDVFLHNKEAVLEMLGRFAEDLSALQRAIRWEEGDKLYETFDKTRRIRTQIIEAKQDDAAPDFGRVHDDPEED